MRLTAGNTIKMFTVQTHNNFDNFGELLSITETRASFARAAQFSKRFLTLRVKNTQH